MVETYIDEYAPAEPTIRLAAQGAVTEPLPARPTLWADAWPVLDIAGRLLICLVAIGVGIRIVTSGGSQGIAVLAAFACAGVVYGLLSPRRS